MAMASFVALSALAFRYLPRLLTPSSFGALGLSRVEVLANFLASLQGCGEDVRACLRADPSGAPLLSRTILMMLDPSGLNDVSGTLLAALVVMPSWSAALRATRSAISSSPLALAGALCSWLPFWLCRQPGRFLFCHLH